MSQVLVFRLFLIINLEQRLKMNVSLFPTHPQSALYWKCHSLNGPAQNKLSSKKRVFQNLSKSIKLLNCNSTNTIEGVKNCFLSKAKIDNPEKFLFQTFSVLLSCMRKWNFGWLNNPISKTKTCLCNFCTLKPNHCIKRSISMQIYVAEEGASKRIFNQYHFLPTIMFLYP